MKRQDGYLTKQSGAWLGHYSRWVTDARTGKRKRQQRAFKLGAASTLTKTQARDKLRERVVSELGITADSRVTVAWFIENRWKPLREGSWRDSTKAVNKELLKFIVDRFGATSIEDMDGVAMQAWLADLAKRKSGSLVRHCRIFLRSIMAEALEQDYCRKNPARLLRVPRLRTILRPYLSLEQIKALLKAAMWQPRDRTLLTVMLVAPFRPSELFALKWKCFDAKRGTLTITETTYRGQTRPYTKTTEEGDLDHVTVLLSDAALVALLKWHSESERTKPDDYIFPNSEGGKITKENYQKRVLTPLADAAEIPRVNFQILRRTVATHAQHLGSPKDISVIMRHRKVETAQQHYIQEIEATVKETVEKLSAKMLTK
jgi:integrase